MREILFRGKRIDDGEWAHGSLLQWPDGDSFLCCADYGVEFLAKVEVEPLTVGQFTGLTDKNGTKIFEGDILRWTADDGKSGVVYVKYSGGVFGLHCAYCPGSAPDTFADFETGGQPLEVISNVHDNPELLGGAENA